MKISNYFHKGETIISFEVFPPKPDSPIETIYSTLEHLSSFRPAFISVTYGAAGNNRGRTVEIASMIKNKYHTETISHLTCTCTSASDVDNFMQSLQENGIDNILALRGDVPNGVLPENAFPSFAHADELVSYIRKSRNDFCIAAAAYPEIHFESQNASDDVYYLKQKIDRGAEFLITQLFFDNDAFFRFLDRMEKNNVDVPITAGLMPILDASQILRMTSLCGCSVPAKLSRLMSKYAHSQEDFAKAGLEYAINQFAGLYAAKVDGIHLYTMNRHKQIAAILQACLPELNK